MNEQIPSLLESVVGGNQCAGSQRSLHDHDRSDQTTDDPVSSWKVTRQWRISWGIFTNQGAPACKQAMSHLSARMGKDPIDPVP
jgi:hypothetical protein